MRMLKFAAAAFLAVVAGTAAQAHAFLDHAEVLGPPELRGAMVGWLETVAAS